MFFEYAVDPAVLSDWNAVRYFLDALVPSRGRFIARYPKRWKRLVWNNVAGLPDCEKKQIELRLHGLAERYFASREGAPYDSGRDWLDNAITEHGRAPFRAIVSAGAGGDRVLDAARLDDMVSLWRTESGALVARDEAAIVAAVELLLRVSSRIVLVDPYFRPDKRDAVRVLVALCRAAGACKTIDVHARLGNERDPTHEHFSTGCSSVLERALPDGVQVTVHTWSQRRGGPRLHNRYLLTDVAGVQFGDSVSGGAAGEQDHLAILPDASRAELWAQYVDPGTGFERIGTAITVTGQAAAGRR